MTRWQRICRLRTPVLTGLLAAAVLWVIGLAVVNIQATAYKFGQLTLVLIFVHFARKEMFPYHDQKSCSDLRALGMYLFMGLVVVAFMVGL